MSESPVEATVHIDLSTPTDFALSKSKFGVFNSGLVPAVTYRRDEAAFRTTRPESVRIDIGWGADWMNHRRQVARPTGSGIAYDFTELDEIGAFLTGIGVRPYWSYCYVPAPYRTADGDWRDLSDDPAGWVDMVTAYVAGARKRGTVVGYHEVYNEPDLRDERTGEAVFFGGGLDDYLNLYRQAAPAIRRTDPSAPVGGPALASVLHNEHWIPAFLDTVEREGLPLDFFSFHHYGAHSLAVAVDKVLSHLDDRPELAEAEVHLNEYNSYPVDYPRGGLQDTHHLAAAMLADFDRLLAWPAVTKVSWAQFLDSGNGNHSGMVDIDGNRKPVLAAYEFFQSMPVDRRLLTVDGPAELGGFAAVDDSRAAVLLWNRASRPVRATVELVGWHGSDAGALRRVDAQHDGTAIERLDTRDGWTVNLPRGGVAFLELGEARAPSAPAGTVTRVRHRYPQRRAMAWGDFDEATTTFRLGTGGDPLAVPTLTAELAGCGSHITVDARISGLQPAGVLTLRLDGPAASTELSFDAGRPEPVVVDLAPLGGGAAVTACLSLHDAAPRAFATVRLS
jgi:xylan 1,4-beta-xylosidase